VARARPGAYTRAVNEDEGFAAAIERPGGRTVVVAARGELDMLSAPELRGLLREAVAPGVDVILDVSGLDFIDSTGVHLVLQAYADSRRDGWDFAIRGATGEVMRAFELTGLADRLPFRDRG
jgi:anti-anti-sigma factor